MKLRYALFLIPILITGCFQPQTQPLIISEKLAYDFNTPESTLHTYNSIILKNANSWISHEVVDGTRAYPNMDLGDEYQAFLKSIFDPQLRSGLSEKLAIMSAEQADALGINPKHVIHNQNDDYESYAYFNATENKGYMVVFEDGITHRFDMSGNQKDFAQFINGIRTKQPSSTLSRL